MTESLTKPRRMRMLLNEGRMVISPGAYDGYSVRLIEQMGFKAASTSGASLANSCVGVPDVGVMDLTANVEACRRLARAVSIPLMADADTGYGSAIKSPIPCGTSRRPESRASTSKTRRGPSDVAISRARR
jgi:2-methylisocitrate lyase-like PEP mutase family enzyme